MLGRGGLLLVVAASCAPSPKLATVAPQSCKVAPPTVHVTVAPPRRGETLHFSQVVKLVGTKAGKPLNLELRFTTDEKVIEVANDAIEDLEVHFVEGLDRPTDMPIDLAGKTVHVRADGAGGRRFTIDDAPAPDELVPALTAYQRDDVGVHDWLTALVTGQSYVKDVEAHFTSETPRIEKRHADAHITLRSLVDGLATFDLTYEVRDVATGATAGTTGKIVLDVQTARLVSASWHVAVHAADADAEGDSEERWAYNAGRPRPPATIRTACDSPATLRIPWRAPRVGEVTVVHSKDDWHTTTHVGGAFVETLVGSTDLEVEEKVLAVRDDTTLSKQFTIRAGYIDPLSSSRKPPIPRITPVGDVIVVDGNTLALTKNGQPITKADKTYASVSRHDLAVRPWVSRVLTDRTYEVGVESVSSEAYTDAGDGQGEVRVMLVSVTGHEATFQVSSKGKDILLHGLVVFDTIAARPVSIELHGQPQSPKGATVEGSFAESQHFQYPTP